MCFGAETIRRSSSLAAVAAVASSIVHEAPTAPTPIPAAEPANLVEGVYQATGESDLVLIRVDGVNYYIRPNDLKDSIFGQRRNTITPEQLAHLGYKTLVPQTPPAPVETINDRLKAAQGETGFKLNDIIATKGTGIYGKVVGFARVNLPTNVTSDPARALVVQYGHDQDGLDLGIVMPSDADPIGQANH